MTGPPTAELFTLWLQVDQPLNVGVTPVGERRIVGVLGGSFHGELLKGVVLPGGSDWITVRPDGVIQQDVRICLQTDDGALILMTYRGLRHGPASVIERLNRGEPVNSSEYYFRTAPTFETASEKYDWLNRIVAVAVGDRRPDGVEYRVFRVL
jgi:hypothetical protein